LDQGETNIGDIRASQSMCEDLIRMAMIADEASAGIGIDWDFTRRIERAV